MSKDVMTDQQQKPTYIILKQRELVALEESVRKAARNGYITCGGVCLAHSGNSYPHYVQAMELPKINRKTVEIEPVPATLLTGSNVLAEIQASYENTKSKADLCRDIKKAFHNIGDAVPGTGLEFGWLMDGMQALEALENEIAAASESIPDILFNGLAVHEEAKKIAPHSINPYVVTVVLDAIVKLLREGKQ